MTTINFWDMSDFREFGHTWRSGIIGEQFGRKKIAREVMGVCDSCQACQRNRSLKYPIESTPIPPAIMSSVCMDFFSLPPVVRDKKLWDTLIVCVDRHSG